LFTFWPPAPEERAKRECEAAAFRLLRDLSGQVEPEELVAFTMIEYAECC
jgi:hypothetical protein